MTYIVPAFADAYKMNVQDAYFYLKKYGTWDEEATSERSADAIIEKYCKQYKENGKLYCPKVNLVRTVAQNVLIDLLNPVITGWGVSCRL